MQGRWQPPECQPGQAQQEEGRLISKSDRPLKSAPSLNLTVAAPVLAPRPRKPFRRALVIHATLSPPLAAVTSGGSQLGEAQPPGRRNRRGITVGRRRASAAALCPCAACPHRAFCSPPPRASRHSCWPRTPPP